MVDKLSHTLSKAFIYSKNIELWAQEALVQLWSASITFKDYFGYILSDREFFASLW